MVSELALTMASTTVYLDGFAYEMRRQALDLRYAVADIVEALAAVKIADDA